MDLGGHIADLPVRGPRPGWAVHRLVRRGSGGLQHPGTEDAAPIVLGRLLPNDSRSLPELVAVRDSEQPDGAKLVVSKETWWAFIRDVQAEQSGLALRSDDAFEDLLVMPGDVNNIHRWLVWPWDQQWPTCKRVHRPARLAPGYIQARNADPPFVCYA